MVLQPADIDFNNSLKYCIKIFNDINNDDKETIILKMKEIFNTYSKASKFVSSDFDIVLQNKNEESIIINVLSDK